MKLTLQTPITVEVLETMGFVETVRAFAIDPVHMHPSFPHVYIEKKEEVFTRSMPSPHYTPMEGCTVSVRTRHNKNGFQYVATYRCDAFYVEHTIDALFLRAMRNPANAATVTSQLKTILAQPNAVLKLPMSVMDEMAQPGPRVRTIGDVLPLLPDDLEFQLHMAALGVYEDPAAEDVTEDLPDDLA